MHSSPKSTSPGIHSNTVRKGIKTKKKTHKNGSPHKKRSRAKTEKCRVKPNLDEAVLRNACPGNCKEIELTSDNVKKIVKTEKPDDLTTWYWNLQQTRHGCPPSASKFRKAKYRWEEQPTAPCRDCRKRRFINPYGTQKKNVLSGGMKRKIVEKWGKMWDSALSDLQFDRIVFENNPDAEQTYKTERERIDDGCQKLWSIAKMNQNIITMMMKKFVSGPPNKLYTLNRIEAAQCWSRIIGEDGQVKEDCCATVDLPLTSRRKYNIPALKLPNSLRKGSELLNRTSLTFRLPKISLGGMVHDDVQVVPGRKQRLNRSSAYWLNPKLVPPVPTGFKEEEFYIEPKNDPTGEIRRDLQKAKEIAQRYTRFANIIEKAVHVVPNLDRVNQIMDENFVAADPEIRRQTLLHNFFSSQKMDTSPEFRRDALYATILSRNDNPKETVVKKPFPYILAEMSKSKSKSKMRE